MKYKTVVIDPPWPYDRVTSNTKLSGYVKQSFQVQGGDF